MMFNYDLDGKLFYTSKLTKLLLENACSKRIEYIHIPFKYKPNKTTKNNFEPYAYQKDIINKLKIHFNNNKRGILQMPCGTGKTFISFSLSLVYQYIIFISPLQQFAKQNLERFLSYDDSFKSKIIDSEFCRNLTTIKKFIKTNKNKKILLSATYKSVDIINKVIGLFDKDKLIIIVDEFHNLSKTNVLNKTNEFYKLLVSDHKILFMSATPRIYDLENDNNDDDFTNLFGGTIYNMNLREAINNKYVCDYKIYIPSISENKIEIINDLKLNIRKFNKNLILKSIFLINSLLLNSCRKCICYFEDTKEIDEFINSINFVRKNSYKNLILNVNKLTYEDTDKNRKNKLCDFIKNKEINILCSVRILDECIDIRECDSIYITYNSKSKIRNVQRICRCNRLDCDNKSKISRIFLWCNDFDELPEFLSGLKEYDPEFKTRIKVKSITGKSKNNNTVIEDMKKIETYIVRVIEYRRYTFDERLGQLKEFIKINNKLPSSTLSSISTNKETRKLGYWCSDMRRYKKNNELDDNKINKLNLINIWYWEKDPFNNHYEKLKKFVIKNNKMPSYTTQNKEEQSLYNWCTMMRSDMRINKLDKYKIKKLESIKCWFWEKENLFDKYYKKIKVFVKMYKKLPSICSKNIDIKKMGSWCDYMKKRKRKNKLNYDKVKKLELINGWSWGIIKN